MKLNKLIIISIFLLAIISVGAASAADDLNTDMGGADTDDVQAASVSEDIIQETQTDDDTSALSNDGADVISEAKTIVVNNETVSQYFGNDGKLSDEVEEGSTLDFQGTITSDNVKTIYINKKVNIVSSTNDGVINLNTSNANGNVFINCVFLDENATGTNISNIVFQNTQMVINTSNIDFNNVNFNCENDFYNESLKSKVTLGLIHILNSKFLSFKNSYFKFDNGEGSLFVIKNPQYLIFDNNVFEGTASFVMNFIGNYTGSIPENVYSNVTNNNFNMISSNGVIIPTFCIFENNTISKDCILNAFADNTIKNNIIQTIKINNRNLVSNNTINGSITIVQNNIVFNNTIIGLKKVISFTNKNNTISDCIIYGDFSINKGDTKFIDNKIYGDLKVSFATNSLFKNNELYGFIDITGGKQFSVINNTIISPYDYGVVIKKSSLVVNHVISNNTILSKKYFGNNAVSYDPSFSNTIENNLPNQKDITIVAENIVYGNESSVVVYAQDLEGNVTLIIDNHEIPLTLVGGYATFNVTNSLYNVGDNNISVLYKDDVNQIYATNETTFNVAKISNYAIGINCVNGTEFEKTTIVLVLPEYANGTAIVTLTNGIYSFSVSSNVIAGENTIEVPGLFEGNYTVTAEFSSDIYEAKSVESAISFAKAAEPTPSEQSDDTKNDSDKNTNNKKTTAKKITLKAAKKTMKIKKSTKKFVLKATVKINGKAKKGLKVTFKFKGKKYTGKTNKKGVAKVTIKKKVIKKLKKGKKYTAKITYGKKTAKTVVKVKK